MFKMFRFQVILIIISISSYVVVSENCEQYETCSQCIGADFSCTWCSDKDYKGPRCGKIERSTRCDSIENPLTEKVKMEGKGNVKEYHIKARPGETVQFDIDYEPKLDYPIDVYYLFDNSYTMTPYKGQLQAEAIKIYECLNETNNVQFGAGSFVEKLAPPFASDGRDKLNTFNNHLPLTNNISSFIASIDVHEGSNLEDPEAGLDALMQVMVCDAEIGWRKEAFKIVVMLTDEQYHSAGDGRSVGAYMPNDMKCHLTSPPPDVVKTTHTYDQEASLLYDYPSVGQISYIAKLKGISIFFTAPPKVKPDYEALANAVYGATFIELKEDVDGSSYLASTIRSKYEEKSQILHISVLKLPSHLGLEFEPNCLIRDKCKIPFKKNIIVTTKVTVKSCNKNRETVTVKFGTFDSLLIKINVETLCECECQKNKGNSTPCFINGTAGKSNGVQQCGICQCYNGWYGEHCQCEGKSTVKDDLLKCKVNGIGETCSGRGHCNCGRCVCKAGYDIPHCQYRTDDCPAPDDIVCAGHGKCTKNKCECNSGWDGKDCSCSTDKSLCVGANGKECSGNGMCNCAKCDCSGKYSGAYCNLCDTCDKDRCDELNGYVLCIYDGINAMKVTNKEACDREMKQKLNNNIQVEIKNHTEVDAWTGTECEKVLNDESKIIYKYHDGNNSTIIWIQSEKEKPPETNIWIPIGSAVGAILLIGILTLIGWKVLVDIMDAREYRKFALEAEKSGYQVKENPLYQPAAVSIRNPTYDDKQD